MPNFSGIWTVTQQMQAKGQSLWPEAPPSTIGQAYGGGFYAGQIGVSNVATHYLVLGPAASAQSYLKYKNASTTTAGADSVIDGPQNTADMVADGNATVYPAAHFCNNLVTGGQTDWYMAAKNELEIFYYNFKPTTTSNNTASGVNANAIPARSSNYTAGAPAQTTVASFIPSTGAEVFTAGIYWSSSEYSAGYAWGQYFTTGYQNKLYSANKENFHYVRAIRRVAV